MHQFKGSSTRYIQLRTKNVEKINWYHKEYTILYINISAIMGAALEPKRWKLSAHSLGNIARQEIQKGNSLSTWPHSMHGAPRYHSYGPA